MLFCNVLLPQALWFPRVRRSLPALLVIAVSINVGMWLERILIIFNTLSHDYMPSVWRSFHFGFWDWSFLIAPLGLFALLFLLFVRLVPTVSMFEMRELSHQEGAA